MIRNLQIDPQRLWDNLMETAKYGGTAKGGIKRLTLSDEDKAVRDWFRREAEAIGCSVSVDELGNMFARRPGKRADLAPIAIGSHLDTQPTGGKFDGVLGVLAGLEVLRSLHESGYETNAPLELVNWTNEEGARFAKPMLGSGVFAGVFTRDEAHALADRDGKILVDELKRIGFKGEEKVGARKFCAMFELHIEQGPILEDEQAMIGVVQGCQGIRWYEVTVTGQDAHTGATPMRLRKNALLGAARVIDRVDAIAHEHGPDAVATVGLIESRPNSPNVVPGEVLFAVDLRHHNEAVLDTMERKFRAALTEILTPLRLTFREARVFVSPAVKFSPELIDCVRVGVAKAGYASRDLISGAGHDATYVARIAPATMIFVPCAGGVSHNEAESTSFDECAAGAQVLLNAVLEYDDRLASRRASQN
jgi:beta-ureidopropionase / N-carbamoyl-L-amino-acid hydrolase